MMELTFSEQNSFLHHGIEGQKWGVRNGPPYPLDSDSKSKKELKDELKKEKKLYRHKENEKCNIYVEPAGYYHTVNGLVIYGERIKRDNGKGFRFISTKDSLERRKNEEKMANNLSEKDITKILKDAFSGPDSKQLNKELEYYDSDFWKSEPGNVGFKFDKKNVEKYFDFNVISPNYSTTNPSNEIKTVDILFNSKFDSEAVLKVRIDPNNKTILDSEYYWV